MPRTPDRNPGPLIEDEEVRFGANASAPSQVGAVGYDGSALKGQDSVGVFNLRGPLATAAPVNVTKAANAVGTAADAARADHKHDVTTAAPAATGVATAAGEGAATSLARSDHVHQSNTAPVNVTKAAAAIGTSGEPARADHKHDVTTAAPGATSVATAAAEGSATSLARSDHVHQSNTAPVNVTKAAAAIGTSGEPARADHKHDVTTAVAVTVGTANAEGVATSLARSDHTHIVDGLVISGQAQGDVLYFNGTAWVRLAAGTNEAVLQTQGAGANPRWILPVRGSANGSTSGPTTTSASFVVIPQMTLTVTTQGGDVRVALGCTFNLQDNDSFDIQLFSDAVAIPGTLRHLEFHGASGLLGLNPGSLDGSQASLDTVVTGLSAGSHTFDARWKRTAGTARARTTERQFQVFEVF